jgi:lipopolysaccharide transport system ATP-binding protein
MSKSIKVENLSKLYRLGEVGTGTLSHDLNRFFAKIRGKEDPFAKIGHTNDRTQKASSDYVWSLKDINFEIEQGDAVGIIGKNGAGKSTLLKILSRVTAPTTGNVKLKGRIASLLEVGTGFHPEMTGRENIYLNGAILGMRKKEIDRKLAEIIDFSGVEKYVDTPVKRYSSGMYVRLAFAVAAHLESEIMIVDEVLAVGDAEFQKKCLGKMGDVSQGEGRTILFVSHNMAAIKTLCKKGLLLQNGQLAMSGRTDEIIASYMSGNIYQNSNRSTENAVSNDLFNLKEISVGAKGKSIEIPLDEHDEIEITTVIDINSDSNMHFSFVLNDDTGIPLFTFSHVKDNVHLNKGSNILKCQLPKGFLNIGSYSLSFYLIRDKKESVFHQKNIINFIVQEGNRSIGGWMGKEPGFIKPNFKWENQNS